MAQRDFFRPQFKAIVSSLGCKLFVRYHIAQDVFHPHIKGELTKYLVFTTFFLGVITILHNTTYFDNIKFSIIMYIKCI